jgi:hypothetical protein
MNYKETFSPSTYEKILEQLLISDQMKINTPALNKKIAPNQLFPCKRGGV